MIAWIARVLLDYSVGLIYRCQKLSRRVEYRFQMKLRLGFNGSKQAVHWIRESKISLYTNSGSCMRNTRCHIISPQNIERAR